MLKDYSKLWIFGDSFSTPNLHVKPPESYWGLTASYLSIPTIKNCSRPGNSLDTVCQLLIGMQAEFDWKKDLFLISIPPLGRITVFDNGNHTKYYGNTINIDDWRVEKFLVPAHNGLVTLKNFGEDKHLTTHYDLLWLETQALKTIFLLTSWLDSKNANYMIINVCGQDLDEKNVWGPTEFLLPYCKNHPRCILKDTYHGINVDVNPPVDFRQYGWTGHHGAAGNKYFFEKSLLPTMEKVGLC
jgi:hypothetical protein